MGVRAIFFRTFDCPEEMIIELRDIIKKLYDRDMKEQLRLDEVENLEREKEGLIKELKILNKNNELLHKEIDIMRKKIEGINNVSNINKGRGGM